MRQGGRVSAGADVRSVSTQEPPGRAAPRTRCAEARGRGLGPPAVPEEEAGVNQSLRRKGSQEATPRPSTGRLCPRETLGNTWDTAGCPEGPEAGVAGVGVDAAVGGRRPETAHSRGPSPAERHGRPGCVMARPRPRFHLLSLRLRPVHAQACLRVCATTLPVYTGPDKLVWISALPSPTHQLCALGPVA